MGSSGSAPPGRPAIRWTRQDLAGTARTIEPWWAMLVAGVDPHPASLATIRAELDEFARTLRADGALEERAVAGTRVVDLLSEAGRAVHEAGLAAGPARGVVAGLFASSGGVPKQPIDRATIGWRGVEGDRQRTRYHHGRIWQALCLWSADVVTELRAEGHPIFPGAAGENVSIAGVDFAPLRPGTRVRFGTVLAEISVPALPCANNRPWFLEGNVNRMHHERHPGASRLYASVVEPGEVRVGDEVVVEP
jgi:MOSC domain-containing protein YiiM